jgi:hypothetical protein
MAVREVPEPEVVAVVQVVLVVQAVGLVQPQMVGLVLVIFFAQALKNEEQVVVLIIGEPLLMVETVNPLQVVVVEVIEVAIQGITVAKVLSLFATKSHRNRR